MKMTLAEVQMTAQNLAAVAMKKLPHRLAYAVGKNLMVLQAEQRLIEERRVEIAKTYADKDENGELVVKDNCYTFAGNGVENFKKEFGEFIGMETEVDIYTVPEELLEQLENERFDILTPAELIALNFMIETQEENADDK